MKKCLFFLISFFWLCSYSVFAQMNISGVVTGQDGEPLIGANVLVKGTSIGAVTDFDGFYEIDVPATNEILIFSYTGFQTREVEIQGRTTINVVLEFGQVLDEVVVTALGVRKEKKAIGY